jgi:tripeptidyl-peptidase I
MPELTFLFQCPSHLHHGYAYASRYSSPLFWCHLIQSQLTLSNVGVGAPCQSNDGNKTPQFTPQFPGTCPYNTAVGGTQAATPEIAWVGSSGGFSNYFARPWYQELAVEDYLNFHISSSTKSYYNQFTNFAGRGFPDVSAHSLTPE